MSCSILYDILSTFAILDVTFIFFVVERASIFSMDKSAVGLGLSDGRDDDDDDDDGEPGRDDDGGGPGRDDDDDDGEPGRDDDGDDSEPGRDDDGDEAGIAEAFADTGAFIVTFG